MTEPIQFVASIIAITSLAETVVTKGYRYLKAVKNCRDDVRKLIAEANVLCGILKRLTISLQDGQGMRKFATSGPSIDSHDDKIDDMEMDATSDSEDEPEPSSKTLETPSFIYECQTTLEEIQSILCKFERSSMKSVNPRKKHRFSLTTLKRIEPRELLWPLSKQETRQLAQTLERHKSTCIIALEEVELTGIHDVLVNAEIGNKHLAKIRNKQEKILDIQLGQEEERLLTRLSPADAANKHQSFKRERHPGTGMWLFQCPEMVNWLDDPSNALWIYGIPGAGKTTLSTLVVDEILTHKRSNTVGTAFFYIRHDDRHSQNPANVLGSIISQLARQNSDALASLMQRDRQTYAHGSSIWEEDVLGEILYDMLKFFSETYIMIDGLDECGSCLDANRSHLIDIVTGFHSSDEHSIRTLIFSRDEQDIRTQFTRADFRSLSIAATSADLRLYATAWQEKLEIHSPDLRIEVVETLIHEANGMFMWVRAQIDYLRRLPNDAEKRKALTHLPPDLPQTYIRIFETIHRTYPQQTIKYIQRILQWLVHLVHTTKKAVSYGCPNLSYRDGLSLDVLCLAICLENDGDWPTNDMIPRKEQVLRWMGCLIRWNQVSHTIHLSHFTIKEFLSADPKTISSSITQEFLVVAEEKEYITNVCLMCIVHRHFESIDYASWDEINELHSKNPLYRLAASILPFYLQGFSDRDTESERLMRKFFSVKPTSAFKLWEISHCRSDLGLKPSRWKQRSYYLPSPLHLASAIGLFDQVERLLAEGIDADAAETKDQSYITPLHLAISAGNVKHILMKPPHLYVRISGAAPSVERRQCCIKMIKKLVEFGADVNRPLPIYYRRAFDDKYEYGFMHEYSIMTPLTYAFLRKDYEIAQLLLNAGAKWDGSAYIDLQDAVDLCSIKRLLDLAPCLKDSVQRVVDLGGFEKLAEDLEEWKLTDNESMGSSSMTTTEDLQDSLIGAFSHGKWQEVRELLTLHPDLDVNCANDEGWYAIHYAAQRLDDTLEFLLKHGASPNMISRKYTTPLCVAAHGGYIVNLRLLLSSGADLDYRDPNGWTPFLASIKQRQISSLEFLLDSGANINARLDSGQGAMHIAIQIQDRIIVSILLERGIEHLGPDNNGTLPLHLACQQGDRYLVEQLLGSMALQNENVNTSSLKYGSPLYIAASSGDVSMINQLLSHGAEINFVAHGNVLGSPLMVACANGHTAATASLLSHGATLEVPMSADVMARTFRQEGVLKLLKEHERTTRQKKIVLPIIENHAQLISDVVNTGSLGTSDAMDIEG